MRHVGLFELCDLIRCETDGKSGHSGIKMRDFGRADDWGSHRRLLQHPGERYLRHRHAALRGDI